MNCFCSRFKKKRASPPTHTVEVDEEVSGIQNTNLYSYKELRMATENFSPANKIGQGGFGSVYKGSLRDGTLAAIKVLSTNSRQGLREFLTEINVIADIKHDNLVKLLGCCVEGNHRILVYGYLENNSLAQTLLGRGQSSIQFNWHTRHIICIELFPNNLTHISTRVAGTEGYLAPEYAIRGQLTRKADIYSFGVLLLEIVSGRSNTNKLLPLEEQYLLERAWELYESGDLVRLVDPSLNEDYNIEEAHRYLKIALLCTQDMPKLRPSMSTVVKMLTGEKDVNEEKISKPGLLSELLGLKVDKSRKKSDVIKYTDSSKPDHSSSSSGNMYNSHATMTFTSINDRSS
ncbi:hypothetical protein LWI28_003858 [Acer negundo]|uniref:Protein kinase domain-containing protein n=1 Tax=Acer negundo TaxID=4023 RepID=A0AAD5J2U3_ACENE|nr:hypothetical protein LWI28_003858 [Acer negundo]